MHPDQLNQIHHASLRILDEQGISLDHPGMSEKLAANGCRLAGGRVFIPPDLVESCLAQAPHAFRIYGRDDDQQGLLVDAQGSYLCTNTGILPNIYDFETGQVRRSVRADVAASTRVLDALSEVDIVYVSLLDATEMPPHMVTAVDFAETMAHTTKPLVGPGLTNRLEARAVIAMAAALRHGDTAELARRPACVPFIGAVTPLLFTRESVDALEEITSAGLPLLALTNPVMGASSPYTIAGSVALGHAEVLAILVLAYALRPGLPIISFNTPTVADMRTLASTTGGPETGLMRALAVELARHLGLPTFGHGHTSAARVDMQAADEKSINALLISLARPSLMGGLGGLANVTLTSYETIVMDNERFGAFKRILQGVDVDDDHLALEVITDLVGGKEAISHRHTVKHLRGQEVWRAKLARRQGLVNGSPEDTTLQERARSEAIRLMKEHVVPTLADEIQQSVATILSEYDAEATAAA